VLYAVDTTPLGRVLELIAKGATVVGVEVVVGVEALAVAIVIFSAAEAVCPFASVTAKVNVLVPALTGVPDMTPDAFHPRPVLQAPEQPVITQL
jgi:hypothetical protein